MSKSKIFSLHHKNRHVGNEYHEINEYGIIQILHESLTGHWNGVEIGVKKPVMEGYYIPHDEKYELLTGSNIDQFDFMRDMNILLNVFKQRAVESVNKRDWVGAEVNEAKASVIDHILLMAKSDPSIMSSDRGVVMISRERYEHGAKHGFTLERDMELYKHGELIDAAVWCLTQLSDDAPKGFSVEWMNKVLNKTIIERFAVAGSLLCAAIAVQKEREILQAIAEEKAHAEAVERKRGKGRSNG